MPNIGAMLKQEITRLSRREIRVQLQAARKGFAQNRRYIAALKRQVAALERQVGVLKRHRTIATAARAASGAQDTKVRFVAKGLKSQRSRLGLSAGEYARLVGVSAQSIYNWEQGNSTPRPPQLAIIATLRGMGKREVRQHLDAMGAKGANKGSSRPRTSAK